MKFSERSKKEVHVDFGKQVGAVTDYGCCANLLDLDETGLFR